MRRSASSIFEWIVISGEWLVESYAIELRTMTSLSSYRELIVWQKSMDLTVRIYALTRCFPAAERYGITSQMRRSASSIFEWIVISGEWLVESYAIELRTMTSLSSYRELIVWQKSMDLTVRIYALTRCFPAAERYGITSQMRRSASSIPANIAEGQARRSTANIAEGQARRECSVAWCCAGLSSGTGNLPDIVNKAGNDNARAMQVLVERLRRDQQNAQRIDQITLHSPLITIH